MDLYSFLTSSTDIFSHASIKTYFSSLNSDGSNMSLQYAWAIRWTVLVETELFRYWFDSAVTLTEVVRCFLPTMRFNARRSPHVCKFVSPAGITPVAGGFPELLAFRHGPWYGSSRKIQQFICFGDWSSYYMSSNNLLFFKLSQINK